MKNIAKILAILLRTTNPVATNTIDEKKADVGITADGCLIKDGVAVPASHGADKHTDRAQKKWMPVVHADDGLSAKGHFYGAELTDGAIKRGYASIQIPEDYVSDGLIQAVIISEASGNMEYSITFDKGADGNTYNADTGSSGDIIEAVVADKIELLATTLSLGTCTKGEIVGAKITRIGNSGSDTVDALVRFLGFVFQYTAEQ